MNNRQYFSELALIATKMATEAATQKAVDSVFAGGDIPDLPEASGENVVEFDIGNLLVVDPRPVDEKVRNARYWPTFIFSHLWPLRPH